MSKPGIVTRKMVRRHENAVGEARYNFEQALKYKKYAKELEARLDAYIAAQAARYADTKGEWVTSFDGDYESACEFFGGPAYAAPHPGTVYVHRWYAA